MNVAVLCSGPSLARTWLARRPVHDLVVGVNRAVRAARCDYWAFNDWETFAWRVDEGLTDRPVCCTSTQAVRLLRANGRAAQADGFRWLTYEQIGTSCPSTAHWTCYSMCVGLVYAEYLLRTRAGEFAPGRVITLYGADLEGEADWDGPSPTRVIRTAHRWQNEINKLSRVTAWLTELGIAFERVRAAVAEGVRPPARGEERNVADGEHFSALRGAGVVGAAR